MISGRVTYDKDEMLEWILDNTRSETHVFIKNVHGYVIPTRVVGLNAPQFLHEVLANLYFKSTKDPWVLIYHIHGGKYHCTFSLHRKMSYGEWPELFDLLEERSPFKSIKRSWYLNQAPFSFVPGTEAE